MAHKVNQELQCFCVNLHDCTWPLWRLHIDVSLTSKHYFYSETKWAVSQKSVCGICSHGGNMLHHLGKYNFENVHLKIFTVINIHCSQEQPQLWNTSVWTSQGERYWRQTEKGLQRKLFNNLPDDTCLLQLPSLHILPSEILRNLSRKGSFIASIRQIGRLRLMDWCRA